MTILRLLLITFFITSCTQPPRNPPLKIGISVWFGYAMAFIAEEKGFFKNNGVKVDLILKPDVTYTNLLYRQQKLDGLFNVFSDMIILDAEGFPAQIVYITDYSDTGDIIFGQPNFNVLSDLKDKTIAFEGINSFSHMLVIKLMERAGIHEGQFKGVNMLASQVLEALDNKEIDAGHIYGATHALAIKKGYKILGKAGDIPGMVADVLVFNPQIVKQRAKEVQGVVKAMLAAEEFLRTNPNEALSIMAKANNMSQAEMAAGIKGIYRLNLTKQQAALKNGGTLFTAGQDIINFYLEKGQLSRLPNLTSIINDEFVRDLSQNSY